MIVWGDPWDPMNWEIARRSSQMGVAGEGLSGDHMVHQLLAQGQGGEAWPEGSFDETSELPTEPQVRSEAN